MKACDITSTITTAECPIAESEQNVHEIWGIVGLIIVFLPGIVAGLPYVLAGLLRKKFCGAIVIAILSIMFPISFLILQLGAILMICCKIKVPQLYQLIITMVTGIESSVESTCQLLLQLFTIIYGYDTSTVQWITIIASLFQLAKCVITLDIEHKLYVEKKTLGFKQLLVQVVKLLPCYISTITFRISSLCLTMAFLREFSIIPLTLLAIEIAVLAWMRCKDIKLNLNNWLFIFVGLVVSNFGVMTASLYYPRAKEDVKEVEKFVRRSTIVTFIHHIVILSIIMVLGRHYPNYMCHWTAPMFILKPTCERFFWVLGTTMMMGCFSLTSIMYRATNIATLKIEEHNPEDPKEKVEDIPLPLFYH